MKKRLHKAMTPLCVTSLNITTKQVNIKNQSNGTENIPDTCTNDESDNHLFTVTCMLAEALIDFATSADDIKTVEGETILKADGKDGSHKIMYYPDGMVTVYKNEPTGDSQFSEYNDGYLVYDFDIGDYSEFVDYANYISENEEEFEPDII